MAPVASLNDAVPALDIATGKMLAQCRKRHRHEEFLEVPRRILRHAASRRRTFRHSA